MTLTLADFAARRWHLARRIDDARAGQAGQFEGHAGFTRDPAGLVYRERGHLTLGAGPAMLAERRYLWRAGDDGIEVLFADGRAFHRIDPGAEGCAARHLCAADTYDVTYDFSAWPDWRSRWSVRGPRKDYVMVSAYRAEA